MVWFSSLTPPISKVARSNRCHAIAPVLAGVLDPRGIATSSAAGIARCGIHLDGALLRFFIGDDLVKTAVRTSTGEVRNKRAFRTREQA